ncbi:MAG TPA: riboflavin synthase [Bacteroidia bacterium]|nr:riboflavin synthase [Bacteroidia bacterium]
MFTGIVEAMGEVMAIEKAGTNLNLIIRSAISHELKIDQSVSHNGVCLTITNVNGDRHAVSAIDETLKRTNLGELKIHDQVNLERSLLMNGRLDGHIVQGHVDQTAVCKNIEDKDGSTLFTFEYEAVNNNITVEKGSICINGVSLTVVDSFRSSFSVAIIPYTFENTSFKFIKKGDNVNLEFDIIGKYAARLLENRSNH